MRDTGQQSTPLQLQGKKALVMGLGVHGGGLGAARFLAQQGAEVTVTDLRDATQLHLSVAALAGLPVRFVLGEHRDEDFQQAELVIKNPGVPASSRFLKVARAAGATIETEMTLFFRLCPGPILGVTGTKGKTTTTVALGAMLRAHFPDTVVAGNLRVSALEQLPRIGPETPVVLELSSFALEGLGEAKLSPHYAVVTNLSPDHLDRYATMAEYGEAKRQIFLHQGANGVLALNRNDPATRAWAVDAPGQVVWFDQDELPATDIRIPGAHNRANIAAAAALASAFGVSAAHIQRAIAHFTGVEHRLEFVRELDGVRYINDTAATVPEAAIAALHSFDRPIVLICGGADKRLEFGELAQAIVERARVVVLLDGTATPMLQAALARQDGGRWTVDGADAPDSHRPPSIVHRPYSDFTAAIQAARAQAVAGDIVLLSPGCASFGMFRNEFHRGEEFRRIVNEF